VPDERRDIVRRCLRLGRLRLGHLCASALRRRNYRDGPGNQTCGRHDRSSNCHR